MTKQAELLELASRCEAATGADRELDAEIAVAALGMVRDGDEFWTEGESYSITEPDYYALVGQVSELAYFTASLDAALTLVPEGWSSSIVVFPEGHANAAVLEFRERNVSGELKLIHSSDMADSGRVKATTPALALCAAALKARAHGALGDQSS